MQLPSSSNRIKRGVAAKAYDIKMPIQNFVRIVQQFRTHTKPALYALFCAHHAKKLNPLTSDNGPYYFHREADPTYNMLLLEDL
jgi:hypothetical protein